MHSSNSNPVPSDFSILKDSLKDTFQSIRDRVKGNLPTTIDAPLASANDAVKPLTGLGPGLRDNSAIVHRATLTGDNTSAKVLSELQMQPPLLTDSLSASEEDSDDGASDEVSPVILTGDSLRAPHMRVSSLFPTEAELRELGGGTVRNPTSTEGAGSMVGSTVSTSASRAGRMGRSAWENIAEIQTGVHTEREAQQEQQQDDGGVPPPPENIQVPGGGDGGDEFDRRTAALFGTTDISRLFPDLPRQGAVASQLQSSVPTFNTILLSHNIDPDDPIHGPMVTPDNPSLRNSISALKERLDQDADFASTHDNLHIQSRMRKNKAARKANRNNRPQASLNQMLKGGKGGEHISSVSALVGLDFALDFEEDDSNSNNTNNKAQPRGSRSPPPPADDPPHVMPSLDETAVGWKEEEEEGEGEENEEAESEGHPTVTHKNVSQRGRMNLSGKEEEEEGEEEMPSLFRASLLRAAEETEDPRLQALRDEQEQEERLRPASDAPLTVFGFYKGKKVKVAVGGPLWQDMEREKARGGREPSGGETRRKRDLLTEVQSSISSSNEGEDSSEDDEMTQDWGRMRRDAKKTNEELIRGGAGKGRAGGAVSSASSKKN
uniref:Uncharacterized protein n=1 Tax=Chromera velia CCMP2878 TaxID=1169474 RepID=A0A0G4F5Z1_9ALVE|eukprot:Cvel_15355.t1-p1 / transcript=Cvel_15355.t1 / gene=Cvel_15355 / organism=Chromera_velia_CCMP2878 / gene_product=hypothetical protein / transcript_product=hypothetical protein / location=Cvel_scaffold1131:7076-8893(+) / protein_length=606 / sequence_SO=supercontig / SO=protein_coding / is_pseudo=false